MAIKFPRFLPRNDTFYELLQALSSSSLAAARALKSFVAAGDDKGRMDAGERIIVCKANSKRILSDVTAELCRSYVTPFDREDIQDFSTQLYKATKTIEKAMERMQLHGLSSHREDFSRQTGLILAEAEAMDAMVIDLSKGRNVEIQAQVEMLHDLELKGDAILGDLLVSLFNEGHTTRDLILRKDIYDLLEKVIDRYRDAAAVALEIVLKHG